MSRGGLENQFHDRFPPNTIPHQCQPVRQQMYPIASHHTTSSPSTSLQRSAMAHRRHGMGSLLAELVLIPTPPAAPLQATENVSTLVPALDCDESPRP